MSHQAFSWVLKDGPRLDDKDREGKAYGRRAHGYRAVLSSIANVANAEGEHAHPGQQTISDESLYSRRQVATIVAQLIAEGWLEVEEAGGGRGKSTIYRVRMDRRETVQSPHGFHAGKGAVPDDKPCGADAETVQSERETVQSQVSDQQVSARQRNTNVKANGTTLHLSRESLEAAVSTFDQFWSIYPRKIAKGDAEKAWTRAVKKASPFAIIEGAIRYRDDPHRDPSYTAHAATWLNGQRWEDEPLTGPSTNRGNRPLSNLAKIRRAQ